MANNYIKLEDLGQEYLKIINYYRKTEKREFYMDFHMHPQIEIMYCEKGSFLFDYKEREKDAHRQLIVPEGCFIVVNTGYFHKIEIPSDGTKLINIELVPLAKTEMTNPAFTVKIRDLFAINGMLAKMKESKKLFHILSDNRNIKDTLIAIVENVDSKKRPPDSEILVNIMVVKLFIDISHCGNVAEIKNSGVAYVKNAKAFLDQNYMNKLRTEDIARNAGISAPYLQRLFRQELNESVHDVLTKIRLEHAKYLLINSGLSSGEIAAVCGFGKREHLIYNFKRFENCTPSEFKLIESEKYIGYFQNTGMIELIDDGTDT